jgi:hypothetical protein
MGLKISDFGKKVSFFAKQARFRAVLERSNSCKSFVFDVGGGRGEG